MAKFKPVRAKKKSTAPSSARGAIPCFILIVTGIVLITLMFYFSLKSSAP